MSQKFRKEKTQKKYGKETSNAEFSEQNCCSFGFRGIFLQNYFSRNFAKIIFAKSIFVKFCVISFKSFSRKNAKFWEIRTKIANIFVRWKPYLGHIFLLGWWFHLEMVLFFAWMMEDSSIGRRFFVLVTFAWYPN